MEKENRVVHSTPDAEPTTVARSLRPLPFQLKASSLTQEPPEPDEGLQNAHKPQRTRSKSEQALDDALAQYKNGETNIKEFAKFVRLQVEKHRPSVSRLLEQLVGTQEGRDLATQMIEGWGRPKLAELNQNFVNKLADHLSPGPEGENLKKDKNGLNKEAKALRKIQEARSLDYLLGHKTGELQPAQINLARDLIAKIDDNKVPKNGKTQGDYWEQLQGKSAYSNQRDVHKAFGEETTFTKEKSLVGGTCNLASLAMSLSYLGVEIPDLSSEFPDKPAAANDVEKLELVRLKYKGKHARTTEDGWGGVARELGADTIQIGGGAHNKDWWEKNVREAHLRKGHAIMCSIDGDQGGHIVRIQAISADGIVVDDPLGKSKPQKGGLRGHPDQINRSMNDAQTNESGPWIKSRTQNEGNVGNNHIWPWKQAEVHEFRWIKAIVRKE